MTVLTQKYLENLASKGVKKVRYFHCDHFEPWRRGVLQEHADEIALFREQSQNSLFSSKMTLFYKPHVPYTFLNDKSPTDTACVPGEKIGFPQLSQEQQSIARTAMEAVKAQGHEIQIHIHHEGYTLSGVNHFPAVNEWLEEHGTAAGDSARMRLTVHRHLEQARMDTGAALDRWAFVHGNWALNGSDDEICRINDEIQILKSLGCVADFTFPAGRQKVDPDILMEPYTCLPTAEVKTYNLPSSDPRPVSDPAARGAERFFIWHSRQRHPMMSLDIYSKHVQDRFENPNQVIEDWICNAPVYDDALYIKTYAHSMNGRYFDKMETPHIPHMNPAISSTFDMFKNLIEDAGFDLEITTGMDVYDELINSPEPVKRIESSPLKVQTSTPDPFGRVRRKAGSVFNSIFKKLKGSGHSSSNERPTLASIDRVAISVIKNRIKKMGDTDSGAYGFYKVRADRGELVTRHERELADSILARDPQVESIVDVGAGLGSMVLAFAAEGRQAIGLEYDRRRVATADAMIEKLKKIHPTAGNLMSFIQGTFPASTPEKTNAKGLYAGITTNIMGTLPSETEDEMIDGLAKFDVCYVDLQRFCIQRDTPEAYEALLERMRKSGLLSQELLLDQGAAGYYYRLAKS